MSYFLLTMRAAEKQDKEQEDSHEKQVEKQEEREQQGRTECSALLPFIFRERNGENSP